VTSDSGWIDAGGKQEDGGSCSFEDPMPLASQSEFKASKLHQDRTSFG